MSILTKDTLVIKAESLLTSEMDDGLVMMSIENSSYYSMDKIGKSIWEAFDVSANIEEICKIMCERYEVSQEECLNDVTTYIDTLQKAGLVQLS